MARAPRRPRPPSRRRPRACRRWTASSRSTGTQTAGKMWLEIGRWNQELLYYPSLPAGLGQNDIGLNRGDLGGEHVVMFERVGPKVLMQEPNYRYRAVSDRPMERKSRRRRLSHAPCCGASRWRQPPATGSWWTPPTSSCSDAARRDPDAAAHAPGHVPAGRVAERLLPAAHQGLPEEHRGGGDAHLHVGPARRAGAERHARRARRSPCASTTRSWSCPPLDGSYKPRKADPRAGYGGIAYMDYAQPIDQDLTAALHRAPPAAEEEPRRRAERAGGAHRLLPGSRHARARALRPARGRTHVEPGVHRGRASSTPSAWRCCPTRRTPWTPATTWCSGCTAPPAGGATATRSWTRAPVRSSRAT